MLQPVANCQRVDHEQIVIETCPHPRNRYLERILQRIDMLQCQRILLPPLRFKCGQLDFRVVYAVPQRQYHPGKLRAVRVGLNE